MLNPPAPRTGRVPSVRLADARRVRDDLNGRPGFAACGLVARLTIRAGGFAVHIQHPVAEPIKGMAKEISGVPVTVGPVYLKPQRR